MPGWRGDGHSSGARHVAACALEGPLADRSVDIDDRGGRGGVGRRGRRVWLLSGLEGLASGPDHRPAV